MWTPTSHHSHWTLSGGCRLILSTFASSRPFFLQQLHQSPPSSTKMHFSMMSVQILVTLSATACLAMPDGSSSKNLKCMDTPRHKASPTPESHLYKTCSVYEGLSCCTNRTAADIHGDNLYKFQNVVCKHKELSPDCKKYFLKDACFYECSPDIAAYVSESDEHGVVLKDVPLCQTNCNNWFSACSNDFTCTQNWRKAMMGSDSHCSANDKCQTIKDKFQNAKDFCEKVWGYSYKVVADDEKCLRFDEPAKRDPAEWKPAKHDEKADDDCHEDSGSEPNSSSSIKYHIVLVGGLPFVLSYFFGNAINDN